MEVEYLFQYFNRRTTVALQEYFKSMSHMSKDERHELLANIDNYQKLSQLYLDHLDKILV